MLQRNMEKYTSYNLNDPTAAEGSSGIVQLGPAAGLIQVRLKYFLN